jgi:putative hemolysin
MLLLAIAVVLLLVLLNGLFAMSELAVVSSRRTRLQTRADRGDRGALAALRLSEDPTRFLSAVQVGITLIGILAGAYGQATIAGELDRMLETAPAIGAYSEQIATGVVVVGLTYFSLILGELVPKRLALIHPESIAAIVARPLNLLARVIGPFVTLLTFSTAGVLRLLGVRDSDGSTVTQEEVNTMLAEGAGAGVIEPEEQAMMHEVMRLGDRTVRAAMTPRTDIYWVSLDDPEDVVRRDVRDCPYSRFVLAQGQDFDSPLGVVHKRDVADALLAGGPLDLSALAKEPPLYPGDDDAAAIDGAAEILSRPHGVRDRRVRRPGRPDHADRPAGDDRRRLPGKSRRAGSDDRAAQGRLLPGRRQGGPGRSRPRPERRFRRHPRLPHRRRPGAGGAGPLPQGR